LAIAGRAYLDAVPAVLEATRSPATRSQVRTPRTTPARLRVRMLSVVALAVALLAATSLLMARMQEQVRVIGSDAAPQASTAADLYFALSDLDAQVARLVLIGEAPALAGSRIDALGTYQQRSRQIDADLQRALTIGTTAGDRATVLALMNHLAVYRQWTWQAMAVQSQAPPQPAGTLPPAALGCYTHGTTRRSWPTTPAWCCRPPRSPRCTGKTSPAPLSRGSATIKRAKWR
jgi:hypothetical protein